jgi:PAS domain S-box-containing protein
MSDQSATPGGELGDSSPHPARVLCVDDDPDVLHLTASFLERESDRIETLTATSASDALDRLAAEPVDCVVSDYQMPGMDGLAFLERVRADDGDIPFVLFTGRGSEGIASEAISAGVTDYVQKGPAADRYRLLSNSVGNAIDRARAERRLDTLSQSASAGLVIVDATGRIRQHNDRLETLFGYDSGELVGEPIDRLVAAHDADGREWWRDGTLHANGRGEVGHELRGVRRDGSQFPIAVAVSPSDSAAPSENVITIRDRSGADDRIQETEFAETLFENAQDALFVVTVDEPNDEFRLDRVNPAYEAHTGLSNEQLRGRTLRAVFGDEEGTDILDRYRECVRRREPLEYEERVTVPENESYWETRIAPVIVDGAVEQLVGATRNVSARKETERRYDAIFNQTYQFTGLLDPDGTVLEANETALEFGGTTLDDVVGKPAWETAWFDDDGRETVRTLVDRASDGEFVRAELVLQGADRVTTVDYSIKPITDADGTVVLLVPEARDITELKAREEELRQQRELLGQIQTIAAVGGWEVDRRTEGVQWTSELYRIHGVSSDYEPTVEDGIQFYHPDDRATIRDAFERCITEGEGYDLELRIVTTDDEVRWVRTLGRPWYEDDVLVGVRGAFQDITERKRDDRELRRKNERLEEFASVVGHDLRNPLTVAQGSLTLARESGAAADFDRAAAAIERMDTLIDDLLTLARQGRVVTATEPVPLEPLVSSVWETVAGDETTLKLALADYAIDADRARLRQLVENLLSNAVRHGGDDVTVRVGRLADGAGFYVEDDGPGIPATERETVFHRDYSTSSAGTGFGLAIVENIAAAHGWTVTATEGADGGARFEVSIGQ